MNSSHRDIEPGETVIIRQDILQPRYRGDTRLQVFGGFGMSDKTIGSAIFGVWLATGEEERWNGSDIDEKATKIFQHPRPELPPKPVE